MFSDISSRVQENLAGVRIIRAYAQEKAEIRKFEELNRTTSRRISGWSGCQGLFSRCCRR